MNLEEYKQWLIKNGNKEEEEAYEVAKRVIEYHVALTQYEADILPRYILNDGNNRIEFDLLIKLTHEKKRYNRLIGIEFKEWDIKKVISQAVARHRYVDYMYIATRDIDVDYADILTLSYFGIGWVIYDTNFAKVIVPAKFCSAGNHISSLVNFLVEEKVKKRIEELEKSAIENIKKWRESLDFYIGGVKDGV